MLNVVYVITKGELGGAQTHLLTLCESLSGRIRAQVIIGESDVNPPLQTRLENLGIVVTRLPEMTNSLNPLKLLRAAWELRQILRKGRPDLVHAHSAVAGAVSRIAGWLAGIPVVYTVHGFGFKPQASWPRRWASAIMEFTLAPMTAQLICVSRQESSLARRLPIKKAAVHVIPNALPDVSERAVAGRNPMRIVMVARFAPPKRQDLLLRAVQCVPESVRSTWDLTFAGDGPNLAALQAEAPANTCFAGDVHNIASLLSTQCVLVHLSDHEGLPLSVIEGMRAGLAIVASDLPGIRELIQNEQEGLLVDHSPDSVARALVRLANSPELRSELALRARQRYETHFQPVLATNLLMGVYDQIVRHARDTH